MCYVSPELMSFVLKMLWRIIPTQLRLPRFKPRLYPTRSGQLCNQGQRPIEETLEHALGECEANLGLPGRLPQVLQAHQPGACTEVTLDLELEPSLELPMTWVIGTVFHSIVSQHEEERVTIAKTRADVESKCRLGQECSVDSSLANPFTLSEILIRDLFQGA